MTARPPAPPVSDPADNRRRRRRLNALWQQAVPLGSATAQPARHYLGNRGLPLDSYPAVLRFHAAVPYCGPDGQSLCRTPSLETAKKLAEGLGVSVSYLLRLDEAKLESDSTDPRLALLGQHDAPVGLRDLAIDTSLQEALQVQPDEWRTLMGLAAIWPSAPVVRKDGWLALLSVMRAVHP